MLLARRTQQVAGLSSIPAALLTRIVGRFKTEEEYKTQVNLDTEKKYGLPLNELLTRTSALDQAQAKDAMIVPRYKEDLPYLGAPLAQVEATKLSNGVTAVAVDSSSPVVHLGVYLGVGTRNEVRANAGILQVMKNTWLGTTTRRTIIAGNREPTQCGANIDFSVGRDILAITASCTRDKADMVLDHMTQNLVCPEFFNHELHLAKQHAVHQTEVALADPATLMLEEAHRLAYRGNGLGRSLFLRSSNSGAIDRDAMLEFAAENFKDSNNIAVVGVGLDSDTVSGLADEYLWSLEGGSAVAPPSEWTGMRESHIEAHGDNTQVLFLTQGAPVGSHDALVLGVMRHLVGGGGSVVHRGNSHSKLATAAAPYAQHPFSTQCVSYSHSDSGMWGIRISANGQEVGDVLKASIGVVGGLMEAASDEELIAAKNKFKLEIITEREGFAGLRAATGVESIAVGTPSSTSQICSTIDSISAEDVVATAKKVSTSCPVLVSYGNSENMPLQRELQ